MLREYVLLKRIESVLRAPLYMKADSSASAPPKPIKLVQNLEMSDDGTKITARVRFAAFKQMVESNPEIITAWGRFGWKVLPAAAIPVDSPESTGSRGPSPSMALGDIPALCIRRLGADNPLAALKAEAGDCVTHIDGESVNQPMRNLAIWVGLARREVIHVVVLRHGKRVAYEFRRA